MLRGRAGHGDGGIGLVVSASPRTASVCRKSSQNSGPKPAKHIVRELSSSSPADLRAGIWQLSLSSAAGDHREMERAIFLFTSGSWIGFNWSSSSIGLPLLTLANFFSLLLPLSSHFFLEAHRVVYI